MEYEDYSIIGSDIDRYAYERILKYIQLRVTDTFAYPPEIIKINGVTIATLGNFSASIGKPKSKKTFNVSAIAAAALSGKEVLCYTAELPEGRHKVLYVDTEQSKCHCLNVMKRILTLAGLPIDKEDDRLLFLMLREYTPKQRRQIINHALSDNHEIGLVIIDGVRDLMRDINSPSESVDIINDLMRWSSAHELHIHTVLHMNKADDNARGHIGTELSNKAETILQVSKSPFDSNISEVKAVHIRDKEFKPFAFHINDDSLPELVRDYSATPVRKAAKNSISDEEHAVVLEKVFAEGAISSYKSLIESLQKGYSDIGYKRGRNVCVDINKYLMGRGVITKEADGYTYHPDSLEYLD
jgi:hypothetical protein